MVYIAVTGCIHGHLDEAYSSLARLEKSRGVKAEVLLCTGDFQALRGGYDLETLSCPAKYRELGDFVNYYSKVKRAPIPTILIGGNHEAVLYMHSARNGGWIAPDIYYLGRCGVVQYGSLRIAGISGIYNQKSYNEPLPRNPRNERDYKSLFRVKHEDVEKISRISPPDIFMSHDWPQGIYNYGDTQSLINKKRFLRGCIEDGSLGSPASAELMRILRP